MRNAKLLLVSVLVAGCASEGPGEAPRERLATRAADDVLASLRRDYPGAPGAFTAVGARAPAWDGSGWTIARAKLRVRHPARLREGTTIRDEGSGVAVTTTLLDTPDVRGELSDGHVVYDSGAATAVVYRPLADGSEEFVHVREPPPAHTLHYDLSLSAEVAGVRKVGDVLEFLDPSGAPRVRMAPPYVLDAKGGIMPGRTSVTNCAVSRDASPPWGLPPTSPGQRRCRLSIQWPSSLAYPVLVDPSWTATGSMIEGRAKPRPPSFEDRAARRSAPTKPALRGPLDDRLHFAPLPAKTALP